MTVTAVSKMRFAGRQMGSEAKMALTLRIENETSLPDGGPLSVTVTGKRGLDIGRDQHLDWTLPDPSRYISGKHCEIRYIDGGYVLYDVSTNGTFLYGSDGRLKGPHRLRNGDRLEIGNYIIAVAIDGDEAAPPPQPPQPVSYQDLWNPTHDAAPPVDPAQVKAPGDLPAPVRADFLDWAVDVPDAFDAGRPRDTARGRPVAPASDDDASWARGAQRPPPPVAPVPPVPTPRRPLWVTSEPDGPWGEPAAGPVAPDSGAARETPRAPLASAAAAAAPAAHAARSEPPPPAATAPAPAAAGEFAHALAHGARVAEHVFDRQDPNALAEQIGSLLWLVVENMRQLLNARLQAKRFARSTSQTTIQALNNNPLKFSPTAEDALRIMFGPPTGGYLDARQAIEQGFDDLKTHQIKTYAAMQQALNMLVADLDPQAIDAATEADRGIAALVVSRKARLWDAYVARWQASARRHDGGMLDAFMQYFAECYDRGGNDMS